MKAKRNFLILAVMAGILFLGIPMAMAADVAKIIPATDQAYVAGSAEGNSYSVYAVDENGVGIQGISVNLFPPILSVSNSDTTDGSGKVVFFIPPSSEKNYRYVSFYALNQSGNFIAMHQLFIFPAPAGAVGDDITLYQNGRLEIRNFYSHLNLAGQIAYDQTGKVWFTGDYTDWGQYLALGFDAATISGDDLTINLATLKNSMKEGVANRFNGLVQSQCGGSACSDLVSARYFDPFTMTEKDRNLLYRWTDADSQCGAGDLVMAVYLNGGRYLPVPEGMEVVYQSPQ